MSESNSIKFTLFQWNTLNRKLADKEYFPFTEDKYLQWYYRHPLIKKIIEENKSDIICLEEVGNFDLDFQKKIFDQCSIKYDLIFEFRSGKLMGNVLAVNKELFSIEKHEVIVLKGEQEGKSSGQSAVVALIKEKKSGNNFLVIVVHLKSKEENEKTRLGQINHLMEYIEKYHLGNYPIFIIGDFNAEPTYSCIIKFLENKNICAKSLFNLNELETKDPTYLSNTRSISILEKCLNSVKEIEKGLQNNMPIDMIELDIRDIWETLGTINGSTYEEELLDEMFSRFCLGK